MKFKRPSENCIFLCNYPKGIQLLIRTWFKSSPRREILTYLPQKRIENPAKHLNLSIFQKQLTASFYPLTVKISLTQLATAVKILNPCVTNSFTVYSIQINNFLSWILFEALINDNLEYSDFQSVEAVLEKSIDISGNISIRNATKDFFLKPKGLIKDFFKV